MIDTIELTMPAILKAARELWDKDELHPGQCRYNAPCAIGAALTPEQQDDLEARHGNTVISELVSKGEVSFPTPDQEDDAHTLQCAFDSGYGPAGRFLKTLIQLEEKYAPELEA